MAIGNGLCRVIVRSEKLARELAAIPEVELRGDDAKHLGWWLIFPEHLRPVIEPVFTRRKPIITRRPEQTSFLDDLQVPENEPDPSDELDELDEPDDAQENDGGEDPPG